MTDVTLRPLPQPEFHLPLRNFTADGMHAPGATGRESRNDGFYLESASADLRLSAASV